MVSKITVTLTTLALLASLSPVALGSECQTKTYENVVPGCDLTVYYRGEGTMPDTVSRDMDFSTITSLMCLCPFKEPELKGSCPEDTIAFVLNGWNKECKTYVNPILY